MIHLCGTIWWWICACGDMRINSRNYLLAAYTWNLYIREIHSTITICFCTVYTQHRNPVFLLRFFCSHSTWYGDWRLNKKKSQNYCLFRLVSSISFQLGCRTVLALLMNCILFRMCIVYYEQKPPESRNNSKRLQKAIQRTQCNM